MCESVLAYYFDAAKLFFRYFYRLLSGPEPLSTFEKDRAWHVPQDLDLLAMQVSSTFFSCCLVWVIYSEF